MYEASVSWILRYAQDDGTIHFEVLNTQIRTVSIVAFRIIIAYISDSLLAGRKFPRIFDSNGGFNP